MKDKEKLCSCGQNVCICNQAGLYYKYYDTPDGCDIVKKTIVTTRYGIITGLVFGVHDVLMYSNAVGLGNVLRRFAYHVIPLALMGATFSVVTNGMIHARNEDDQWNYCIGGMACAPILAWYLAGSKLAILPCAVTLGAIGLVKKTAVDCDWVFFPVFPREHKSITSWRNDYTIKKDPRDEWRRNCCSGCKD